ncbi:MAG: ThuA domain-containing protein [Thalassotalea sp.]
MKNYIIAFCAMVTLALTACTLTAEDNKQTTKTAKKIKTLIIDGQNNHGVWPKSTMMMKSYLEETGLFTADIYRSENLWRSTGYNNYIAKHPLNDGKNYQDLKQPKTDPNFQPNFEQYDLIVSNFGWKAADWPAKTKAEFEKYMKNGGGLVVIHAADNSFPKWTEFNKMIGLGGWGNRNETDGPYKYYNKAGKLITDTTKGGAGAHGKAHEFQLQIRDTEHPITKGLPKVWLHTKDELYAKLRGPAENLTILASAYPQNVKNGDVKHEPILMTIDYHQGRVFHSTLGHDHVAFEGVGFITTFLRGAEWAATGKVTQAIPADFPTAENASKRAYKD